MIDRAFLGTTLGRWLVVPVLAAALPASSVSAASVAELYRQVDPSVVVVLATHLDYDTEHGDPSVEVTEFASGFLVDASGTVVTAAHVLENAARVTVRFAPSDPVAASVVRVDFDADVAILHVPTIPSGRQPLVLGDSGSLAVGDEVCVIASPLGGETSLSCGHLNSRRSGQRTPGLSLPVELLETDAVLGRGSPGGPMFDMQGRVVGIVTSGVSREGTTTSGTGFGVPAERVYALLADNQPLWFGVSGTFLTGEMATTLNLPQPSGLLVESVWPGSPASRLGIRNGHLRGAIEGMFVRLGGDVILEIQGRRVPSTGVETFVREQMTAAAEQGSLQVVVLRGGAVIRLSSTISDLFPQSDSPQTTGS